MAYWFPPDLAAALRRNAARVGRSRVAEVGVRAVMARLLRPELADGFDAVQAVSFDAASGFRVVPAGLETADAC